MSSDEFSDEDLTAFLDGEADEALTGRLTAALSADASLRARLEALDIPMAALSEAGDLALAMAPDAPTLPDAEVGAKGWLNAGSAMVAGVALAVGIGLGTYLAPQNTDTAHTGWIDAVAAYQVLYVPETVAATTQPLGITAEVLAKFSATGAGSAAEARDIDGLRFARAQLLGFGAEPLLQMAYATEDGTPVAICAVRVAEPDRAPASEMIQGLAATHWVSDGVGFLVIGGRDLDQTQAWAEEAVREIAL